MKERISQAEQDLRNFVNAINIGWWYIMYNDRWNRFYPTQSQSPGLFEDRELYSKRCANPDCGVELGRTSSFVDAVEPKLCEVCQALQELSVLEGVS